MGRIQAPEGKSAAFSLLPVGPEQRSQPVQITLRPEHPAVSQRLLRLPGYGPFFRCLCHIFHGSYQNQFFPGPCHGHIKHPDFFTHLILKKLSRKNFFSQSPDFGPVLQVHPVGCHTIAGVNNNPAPRFHKVHAFSEPRHKTNRIFKSFTFMDTHNPDGFSGISRKHGFTQILFGFF